MSAMKRSAGNLEYRELLRQFMRHLPLPPIWGFALVHQEDRDEAQVPNSRLRYSWKRRGAWVLTPGGVFGEP